MTLTWNDISGYPQFYFNFSIFLLILIRNFFCLCSTSFCILYFAYNKIGMAIKSLFVKYHNDFRMIGCDKCKMLCAATILRGLWALAGIPWVYFSLHPIILLSFNNDVPCLHSNVALGIMSPQTIFLSLSLSKEKANKVPDRVEDKEAHIVGKQRRRWDYTSKKLWDLIHSGSRHHLTNL